MDTGKIGETIAKLRIGKNMTQAELGERLNVSFQAVSKWERGETLPDVSLLPSLADTLETTIDYILRNGEMIIPFKGKTKISDLIEGLNALKTMREKLGCNNTIYRCAVDGINSGMNTDIEAMFNDEFVFEAFLAELVIQNLMEGMYVDVIDIMHSFKHEHFRNIVLENAKKYSVIR